MITLLFLSFPCTMRLPVSRLHGEFFGKTCGCKSDRSVCHDITVDLVKHLHAALSAAVHTCHRRGIQHRRRNRQVTLMGAIPTESVLWHPPSVAPLVDDRSRVVQHCGLPVRTKCVYDFGQKARPFIFAPQGPRHACEQDDKLDGYTWTQYDPREGGVQEIKDSQNNVKITTEFLKVPGGKNGGSWAARIRGEPMDPCERRLMNSIPATKAHMRWIPHSDTHAYFHCLLLRSRGSRRP